MRSLSLSLQRKGLTGDGHCSLNTAGRAVAFATDCNDFTCFHLWRIATCLCHRRRAEARKTIGWTVFGGMLAATTLAIFVVPVLFVLITKIAYGRKLKRLRQMQEAEEEIDQTIAGTL